MEGREIEGGGGEEGKVEGGRREGPAARQGARVKVREGRGGRDEKRK